MNTSHEKLTDLQRLSEEIIRQPIEKALPCNLSDEWLHLLERDFRIVLRKGDVEVVGDPFDYMKAPLTLISHLAGRCKTPRNRASSDPLQPIFHDFIPGIGFPIPF